MNNSTIKGNVSFVNHEKKYILIEYEQNGKKKAVKGPFTENLAATTKEKTKRVKTHLFHIGDTVTCTIKLSDRGDRMVASNIKYLYNTALDLLIEKARTSNNFTGYLKIVDARYYVKEVDSYLFFPLPDSPWLLPPSENELNEAVIFSLENIDKKNMITAKLFNNHYIPEFYKAVKAHKSKTPVEAVVYKITPHGIYLQLFGDKMQSKIPFSEQLAASLQIGDTLPVIINYISNTRIIVEPA